MQENKKHSVFPTVVSVIKLVLFGTLTCYFAVKHNLWGVLISSAVAILLDYLDGFLAWLLGSIRFGDIIDGVTDLWQFPMFIGLAIAGILPWLYVVAIGAIGLISFVGVITSGSMFSRFFLGANSITGVVISECLISYKLVGGYGVWLTLIVAAIIGLASVSIINANLRGEPIVR